MLTVVDESVVSEVTSAQFSPFARSPLVRMTSIVDCAKEPVYFCVSTVEKSIADRSISVFCASPFKLVTTITVSPLVASNAAVLYNFLEDKEVLPSKV